MVDHREHPEAYRVGRGEQGVFRVEPYKGELLPLWRFATPAQARESSDAIWAAFRAYLDAGDLVGADMARKYLQMGYTRSMRYARHPGGTKAKGTLDEPDADKLESARLFRARWDAAEADQEYVRRRAEHRREHG